MRVLWGLEGNYGDTGRTQEVWVDLWSLGNLWGPGGGGRERTGFGGNLWGLGNLGRDLWGLGVLWGAGGTQGDPRVLGGEPGDAGAEVTAGPSAAHAPGASSPPL